MNMSTTATLRAELCKMLKGLPKGRPVTKTVMDGRVSKLLEKTKSGDKHAEWENVCRRELLLLTVSPS